MGVYPNHPARPEAAVREHPEEAPMTIEQAATPATATFTSSSTLEAEYVARSGQSVTVVGACDEANYDRADTGAMWVIRFADGFEGEAFDDELSDRR